MYVTSLILIIIYYLMINYIVLLSLVFLTISFFKDSIKAEIVPIFAESPTVKIFPNCGALSDHKIFFTVTSFSPNGNVHWEFIDSKGNIDSYGYFDDKNNNFLKDFNGSEVIINYQIPCANPIF